MFLYNYSFFLVMKNHLKFFVIPTIMLSLFSITMLSFAYAQNYGQVPDMPKEVSGNYANDAAGVRITFPTDWSGIEMETSQGILATVVPGGMESGEPSQIMTLMMMDKTKVKEAPSDPTQGKSQCDTPTVKKITVSGADGTESVMTCTDDSGKKTKAKIVSAQTEERWISVMFMAPVAEFDGSVGKFDDSIKTLSILNVMETEKPVPEPIPETTEQPPGLQANDLPVSAKGEIVNVKVQSSSTITKFGLDENSKKVIFTADGDKAGTTRVALAPVLKGPFVVMMDEQEIQNFTTDDLGTTVELTYSSGHHDFSISGTQVVPEFPVAMVGLIVAIVGMVAIIGRTKIFGNLKY